MSMSARDDEFRGPYGRCIVCGAPRLIVTWSDAGTTSYELVCTADSRHSP